MIFLFICLFTVVTAIFNNTKRYTKQMQHHPLQN